VQTVLNTIPRSERILVLAPTGQDGPLTVSFLIQHGIGAQLCRDMSELLHLARQGCAAILLAEEALNPATGPLLADWLRAQPSWSEVPITVVTGTGEASGPSVERLGFLESIGNTTLLERPFRPITLVNSMQAALRSRRWQYQVRDLLQEREKVLNSITDVCFVLDSAWRVLAVNRAAERVLFQRPAAELIGRSLAEEFPQDLHAEFYLQCQRALREQEPVHCEARFERVNRWFDVHGYPLPDRLELYLRDITERKAAERASQLLAAIVESSSDAVISKNINGVITTWNAGAERLFGYAADEVIGQPVTILMPPERINEEPQILERIRRGETVDHYETVRRRKDGTLLDISLTISPIKDSKGVIIGASKIARDITERKRTEQALRDSEARFRQLADAMPQIVWTARADGYVDYYNRRWYEYTGFPETYGDASWQPILHPNDVQRSVETWSAAVRSGHPYEIEYRFIDRRTGGYRWHLGRALPVRNEAGEIAKWFGTCTDIDDQKRIEERFVRLNETLVAVLEAIPDPVFVTDPDGAIQFMNPAADRLGHATGLRHQLPTAIHAELQGVLQTGEHHLPTTLKTVHRFAIEKEERYFLSRIVSMAATDTRIFGAVVMLQDVTEFRLLDEVKTNLISTVSHELKTPITSLQTALFLVLEQTLGPLNSKQAEMLGIAHDEAERLLRTLETLLDLTRFEENTSGLRQEPTAPEELVRAAVEESRVGADNARVSVQCEIDPDLPLLPVDRDRIVHVLTNFLGNAIKYSPSGSSVCIRARLEGLEVYFSVKDNGPGVPEPYQSRIFDRFFRVPGTRKRGVGLGLFIAREFVRAHGGRIGVNSTPGQGSEFYFTLPLKRD
jgi:PAS domain S-box-containing protein